MNNNRKVILNVPVDTYNTEEFTSKINGEIDNSGVMTIFAINPEKILNAQKNPSLFSALKEADFLIPDGIGTTIGIRIIYGKKVSRTTGITLMHSLLHLAEKRKLKVFIFASRPLNNKMALENIKKQYPHLHVVGTQHGYLHEGIYMNLIEKINSLGTDILFVGLGSPKQEEWINKYKKILKVKICMGVGGSLDVIAGRIPGAPSGIRQLGIEWLYRLIREPKRFKRQMVLPKFAFEIVKEKISFF